MYAVHSGSYDSANDNIYGLDALAIFTWCFVELILS
jgi:hypothetical protein